MESRVNTLLFVIDNVGQNVTSLEFQRFLKNEFVLNENDVIGIQREFGTRRVYVKFKSGKVCDYIASSELDRKIKCEDGTLVNVNISHAGLGYREVRVFNLPFEMPAEKIAAALEPFGKVIKVTNATYGGEHLFPMVDSGVRVVRMELREHVPSFVYVGASRARATVVYDGQPRTCARCNKPGHLRFECPEQRVQTRLQKPTFSDIVNNTASTSSNQDKDREDEAEDARARSEVSNSEQARGGGGPTPSAAGPPSPSAGNLGNPASSEAELVVNNQKSSKIDNNIVELVEVPGNSAGTIEAIGERLRQEYSRKKKQANDGASQIIEDSDMEWNSEEEAKDGNGRKRGREKDEHKFISRKSKESKQKKNTRPSRN